MTSRLDDRDIEYDKIAAPRSRWEHRHNVMCDELLRLRSLFTPETVAALERAANAVNDGYFHCDQATADALRALASAVSK